MPLKSHACRLGRVISARSVRPVLECLERRELLAAGDLDPNFGTAGRAGADFFGSGQLEHPSRATEVALLADGKVLLAGWVGKDDDRFRIGVERLNPDGTHDPTFDGD